MSYHTPLISRLTDEEFEAKVLQATALQRAEKNLRSVGFLTLPRHIYWTRREIEAQIVRERNRRLEEAKQ